MIDQRRRRIAIWKRIAMRNPIAVYNLPHCHADRGGARGSNSDRKYDLSGNDLATPIIAVTSHEGAHRFVALFSRRNGLLAWAQKGICCWIFCSSCVIGISARYRRGIIAPAPSST